MNTTDKDYLTWFRHCAPYINAHQGKTCVILLPGEAITHANFENIIHDIALLNSLGMRLVLVHGARPQVDHYLAEHSIENRFKAGMRITDAATLEAIQAVIGSLRSHIESLLSMGVVNSPMHGANIQVCSGNLVIAQPVGVRDGVDFGYTGAVRSIDTDALLQRLDDGAVVLLSAQGYSRTGEVFNVLAAEVAVQTAIALQADKLILFAQAQGLLDENGQLIRHCDVNAVKALHGSHRDKVDHDWQAMIDAFDSDRVQRCHCISYQQDGALLQELFTRDGSGTLIAHDHYEQLRQACSDDINGILALIEPLEERGLLVKRSRVVLENDIDHFTVIERDGMIVACVAFYIYTEQRMGEIACLAIHEHYRGGKRGEHLLQQLEVQARAQGIKQLFALTTQAEHWFRERAFKKTVLEHLPTNKKTQYSLCMQRNAKVLIKDL